MDNLIAMLLLAGAFWGTAFVVRGILNKIKRLRKWQ